MNSSLGYLQMVRIIMNEYTDVSSECDAEVNL